MKVDINMRVDNKYIKLPERFYTRMRGEGVGKDPKLIALNRSGLELIGLSEDMVKDEELFVNIFSGNKELVDGESLSQVYSGHQFGVWAGQLGDGRALLIGQLRNSKDELWDIQLKGSGITPYSRMGDGKAVLRSCIREYLCSEGVWGLGIGTTRSLCIVGTGEDVYREQVEPGAVFTRLARTHVRFGHFEHCYSRGDIEGVKLLADYVINEYTNRAYKGYAEWFYEVMSMTARLIALWQAVGFCHGVMNTDNMSILGETIDYGPFGFMEKFQKSYICNHSDHSGRYSYENQPLIGLWNLQALAYALQSLISKEEAIEVLKEYNNLFLRHYKENMREKLGFEKEDNSVDVLWEKLLGLMEKEGLDYTNTFRNLSKVLIGDSAGWLKEFKNSILEGEGWLKEYKAAIGERGEDILMFSRKLNEINPKYVLRNWVAEKVIRLAEDELDYSEIDRVLRVLQSPYSEHIEYERYAKPAPMEYSNLSVSCSS